jgi:aspartoacylase
MVNINRVAIVGGTHGNEFTGVYLINKLNKIPKLVQRPSFKTQTIIANIWAFNAVKRYIDKDLNRCFATADLQNDSLCYLEEKQAKCLNRTLGSKGNSQVDFILDLHSTTANMGVSLILVNQNYLM